MKFIRTVCWLSAIFIIVCWVIGTTRHPGNANIVSDIFIIKYAIHIFIYNSCLLLIVFPFLVEFGVVGSNYHHDDKITKSKTDFIVLTISLPGVVSLFIAIFTSLNINRLLAYFALLSFLYKYFISFYSTVKR